MKFTEAISRLQKSGIEEASALAKFFSDHFKTLESNYRNEEDSYKQQLQTLLEAAKGEGLEIGDRLESATKKIAALNEELTKTKDTLTAKEAEYASFQRKSTIKEAALSSSASQVVLEKLITDEDTLEITTDGAKVNGKLLKDWAEANHPDFVASLILPEQKDPPLGTGGSNPPKKDGETASTVDSYLSKNYPQPSFLK